MVCNRVCQINKNLYKKTLLLALTTTYREFYFCLNEFFSVLQTFKFSTFSEKNFFFNKTIFDNFF